MPFKNTNVEAGLAENAAFQVGVSDVDDGGTDLEKGSMLPWSSNKSASWMYFDCTVGVMLDSGIAVHNRLPQVNRLPDTLASCALDDPDLDKLAAAVGAVGAGVNLKCNDQYQDIAQRMAHARYWFRLWGQALRVGYQVPIPGLKSIGGVPAIPYDRNPQWAFNRITPGGNYGGVILWHASWSLWYTTTAPPKNNTIPASDPSAHISGAVKPPAGIQAPISRPDDDAVTSTPVFHKPRSVDQRI